MSETGTSAETGLPSASLFVREIWYMAALAAPFRPGVMQRVMLLGEPVAIGRMQSGALFALRDICPHRGVPLSAGKVKADDSVECPYHGWRFKAGGTCSAIPSLVEGQDLDPSKIKVRSYPVMEQDGLIWVFVAAKPGGAARGLPPKVPMIDSRIRWHETQMFPCGIDHAVIGLMDPCHAAYVHDHWWWKTRPRLKEKHYAPLSMGFTMTRHKPVKPAYGILGEVSTEITFELP
ncbi:MAG: Rieske (2Fe-2S) protein, partial [Alphaproteobacteria bacterium]|nr:Rieske (2Fe-2S) protein [Alphaproteobacteria bacterium]